MFTFVKRFKLMAIRTLYGNALRDPASPLPLSQAIYSNSGVRHATDTFTVLATDNAGSVFYLAKVPSHAIILPSFCDHAALTGGSFSWGLYDARGVVTAVPAALGAAASYASAAVKYINTLAPANKMKRVWELLNLTQDPGRDFVVALTQTVDVSAGGAVFANLQWIEGR